jgi:predicted aconitase with swiveling domain
MAVFSKSVRGGITAMLTEQGTTQDRQVESTASRNGVPESDILLARSGYIVVAG